MKKLLFLVIPLLLSSCTFAIVPKNNGNTGNEESESEEEEESSSKQGYPECEKPDGGENSALYIPEYCSFTYRYSEYRINVDPRTWNRFEFVFHGYNEFYFKEYKPDGSNYREYYAYCGGYKMHYTRPEMIWYYDLYVRYYDQQQGNTEWYKETPEVTAWLILTGHYGTSYLFEKSWVKNGIDLGETEVIDGTLCKKMQCTMANVAINKYIWYNEDLRICKRWKDDNAKEDKLYYEQGEIVDFSLGETAIPNKPETL